MESNQYFSVVILSVCAIHLAATAGVRMQGWWQAFIAGRHRLQRPPVQVARGGVSFVAKIHQQQRSDWYVFFHCAELVGKEPSPKSDFHSSRERLVPPTKKVPISRTHQEIRLTLS